ncbi:hypothetical protein [Clostridium septicum]|uniref:hypothetical protein n=1 Tax=Clostridium septicum TaxID=1504 RepID=UPI00159EEF1B|nr:hypothetical protein [Clostridium septicum]
MLIRVIENYKSKISKDEFNLMINLFNEDVSFHKNLREDTEESLCEVLNQCFNVVKRLN